MPDHAMKTDGVWRVMRFEREDGKYAEVASNQIGPEGIPVPEGYKFVSAIPMVPEAEVERLREALENATEYLRLAHTWIEDYDRHIKTKRAWERARLALALRTNRAPEEPSE